MRQLPFIKNITESITNPAFVASRVGARSGKAIGHILIVILIFASLSGLIKGIYFNNYINQVLIAVEDTAFPDFEFTNGVFSFDSDEPYVYESGEFIFVVDTSGQSNINNIMTHKVGYLLNSNTLIMNNNGDTNYVSLDIFSLYNINKDEFVESLQITSSIAIVFYTVGNVLLSLLGNLFRSIILLFLSFFLLRVLQIQGLRGSQTYSLVLHSMTIGVILFELGSTLPYLINAQFVAQFFYLAGSFVFFYFPASTVMSQALRYMKLHAEVSRLSNILQDQNEKKKQQQETLNRYRRLDEQVDMKEHDLSQSNDEQAETDDSEDDSSQE